jgi:galactose mutarotase-like enzyme
MPKGGYTGVPLNAPYANRLSECAFEVGGRAARIARKLPRDRNGTPIHGTLHAQPFEVLELGRNARSTRLVCRLRHDGAELLEAFPFRHELIVAVELSRRGLAVTTSIQTDERVPVPVSFGWHPFLRVPTTVRSRWQLRLPPRGHVSLDDRLLPTGRSCEEPEWVGPLARRTFDDHYALGRDRRFTLTGHDRSVDMQFDRRFAFVQIYLPPSNAPGWSTTDFVCVEPMTAPVNALVDGGYAVATTDEPFAATFTISARRRDPIDP